MQTIIVPRVAIIGIGNYGQALSDAFSKANNQCGKP